MLSSDLLNSHSSGYLNIVVGPMCSGKSLHLIANCEKLADIGFKSLIIIPELETRNYNSIFSHSSGYSGVSKKIDVIQTNNLLDINITDYDIISVDECQFFDKSLHEAVEKWLYLKKRVYLASLDGDSNQKIFGFVSELLPLADDFVKIKSKCLNCCRIAKEFGVHIYNDAIFTIRKSGNDQSTILVGGLDIYEPVCRYHLKN